MKSNSERIGSHIRLVDVRDKDEAVKTLLGLSIDKKFIPSVANTIGTNLANYKIVRKGQFACSLMQVRRDKKMPVALLSDFDEAIISPAYPVFEIVDEDQLLPEYLMMWMRRPEFDREACFYAVGGVRGSLEWEDFCSMELPVPSPEKQREIVAEYRAVVDRIRLNERLNKKLEETARAIYRHWFIDFEFPMTADQARALGKSELEGQPYKSSGGELVYNETLDKEIPVGWDAGNIGQYSPVKSGFAFKSEWWRSSGVPVVKIGTLQNRSIEIESLAYVEESKSRLAIKAEAKAGSVVIAMTGATIGKVSMIPAHFDRYLINQRVGLFDLGDIPIKRAPFLYLTLLQQYVQEEVRNVGGDSAQANISPDQIGGIEIVMPSTDLVDQFNSIIEQIIHQMMLKQQEIAKLWEISSILKSRLAVAFTQ